MKILQKIKNFLMYGPFKPKPPNIPHISDIHWKFFETQQKLANIAESEIICNCSHCSCQCSDCKKNK